MKQKKIKKIKNQASVGESCKHKLFSQTHNMLNYWLGLNLKAQHPSN